MNLLACPFCGKQNPLFNVQQGEPHTWYVRCRIEKCGARVEGKTAITTMKKWNTRGGRTPGQHMPTGKDTCFALPLLGMGMPVIDSQAFSWILLIGFVFVACAMVIGFAQGYRYGHSDGWDDAERFMEDELQFGDDQWTITDEGQRAARAARLAEIDAMLLTPQQTLPFVKSHSRAS
jgi:hypothetical protein